MTLTKGINIICYFCPMPQPKGSTLKEERAGGGHGYLWLGIQTHK